jgi:DNA-binding response OmpR family regulator
VNTILIIEDDAALARGLEEALRAEHYRAILAPTGARGFSLAIERNVDLIILDLLLPDRNGMQICSDLRSKGIATPILMLTSKTDELDKVLGLETGADDYVTKPFSTRELLARINALLRRRGGSPPGPAEARFGDVHIDFRRMEASRRSERLRLTAREFEVLKHLISRGGEVVSRHELLNRVWGYDRFPTTRTVDTCIQGIRKKIEDNSSTPRFILTVHGAGYRFNPPHP